MRLTFGMDFIMKAIRAGYNEEILEKAGLVIKKRQPHVWSLPRTRDFPRAWFVGKDRGVWCAHSFQRQAGQPTEIHQLARDGHLITRAMFFGLYFAKNAIRQADNCFLVEGYTDVISMHQSGHWKCCGFIRNCIDWGADQTHQGFTDNITVLSMVMLQASKQLRGIDMIWRVGQRSRGVVARMAKTR